SGDGAELTGAAAARTSPARPGPPRPPPSAAPPAAARGAGRCERRIDREQRVGALCTVLYGGVMQLRRGEAGESMEAEVDQALGLVGEGGHRGGGDGSS